jgi:hypothetical protein
VLVVAVEEAAAQEFPVEPPVPAAGWQEASGRVERRPIIPPPMAAPELPEAPEVMPAAVVAGTGVEEGLPVQMEALAVPMELMAGQETDQPEVMVQTHGVL